MCVPGFFGGFFFCVCVCVCVCIYTRCNIFTTGLKALYDPSLGVFLYIINISKILEIYVNLPRSNQYFMILPLH